MKILVSNDDGINARGIHELVSALAQTEGAEIYVSAPHMQRSAAGHGMTLRESLFVREVEFEGAVRAYEVSGTPTDCVKMGLYLLEEQGIKIDMVFSGINHGGNLGTDVIYSGTVAAALEGAIHGYPAVAVSVDIPQGETEPQHFEYAAQLTAKFAEHGFDKLSGTEKRSSGMEKEDREKSEFCGISKNTVININVPDLPADEIKGVKTLPLGPREYSDEYTVKETKDGKNEYGYRGMIVDIIGLPENLDAVQILNGYATVTPLKADLTDYALMDDIAALTDSVAGSIVK